MSGPPVSGLIGWWDCRVAASLTLSGSNVVSVADLSGGGQTIAAVGSANSTYSATGFDGGTKPGIEFSGNAALETASGFPMGTGNTMTAWFIGTLRNDGAGGGDADQRSICILQEAWGSFETLPFPGLWVVRSILRRTSSL
jgi:hypothetical protein